MKNCPCKEAVCILKYLDRSLVPDVVQLSDLTATLLLLEMFRQ
jgi:hypothetical protein